MQSTSSPQVFINMRIFALLALCFLAVPDVLSNPQRIVGGEEVAITQYPSTAALLHSRSSGIFTQACGGTIINSRSILTAAQCTFTEAPSGLRIRVGSALANSGGAVYGVSANIIHPSFDAFNLYNDLAILRSPNSFAFNDNVRPVSIAGSNYILNDWHFVTAVGWGPTSINGPYSEQLHAVELVTINHDICSSIYDQLYRYHVSQNMLCAGWPLVGERDQCEGDTGGPLYHNGVLVGVFTVSLVCGANFFPSINTRVSNYTSWIQDNA